MKETADVRRKRLLFQCKHRGSKEADILLGSFTEAHVAKLSEDQLERFEALLDNADSDIYAWITGRSAVPAAFDTDVMALLKTFMKNRI